MPQRILTEPEFNAIRDHVLKAAPDGLDEASFGRYIGPVMAQAVGEAESSPKPVEGSAIGRFVSGAWEMVNPVSIAQGLYQTARHPIDTATNIAGQMGEQFSKSRDAAQQGRVFEASGHALAGVLPVVGPMAAGIGEQVASGDVAGGLGKASALVAPFAAADAVKAVGRDAGVLAPTQREIVAERLKQIASEKVTDVMAPKIGPNKTRFGNQAAKVAPELVARGDINALSREGLHANIATKLADAEAGLDEASDARMGGRAFPTKPIVDALEAKRAKLSAPAVEGSRIVPQVQEGAAAVRETPVNPLHQYALRWMKDEMESFPFAKKTFREAGRGRGGDLEVTGGGTAGAPIYRQIVGPEGGEWIKASRSDVLNAINNALTGKPQRGDLAKLVKQAATDLVEGRTKSMLTPGPSAQPEVASRIVNASSGKPAEFPALEGRPIGQDVTPGPVADRAAVLDKAIAEVKQLGPMARYEAVRRIREAYDGPAKMKYVPSLTQDFLKVSNEASGAADVTGVLREHLAKWDPATAKANANYSLYKSAHDVLQAAEEIERVRPTVGRTLMARGLGAATGAGLEGSLGAAVGAMVGPAIERALASAKPAVQLQTARLVNRLATAIQRGDVGLTISLRHQLKALSAEVSGEVGRTTNPTESQSQTTAPAQ